RADDVDADAVPQPGRSKPDVETYGAFGSPSYCNLDCYQGANLHFFSESYTTWHAFFFIHPTQSTSHPPFEQVVRKKFGFPHKILYL
ncbi:MAG: hypothetical protein IJ028_03605, partial [Alistipes sp.]|nr:hypothetical protein [Alistipes sp.]